MPPRPISSRISNPVSLVAAAVLGPSVVACPRSAAPAPGLAATSVGCWNTDVVASFVCGVSLTGSGFSVRVLPEPLRCWDRAACDAAPSGSVLDARPVLAACWLRASGVDVRFSQLLGRYVCSASSVSQSASWCNVRAQISRRHCSSTGGVTRAGDPGAICAEESLTVSAFGT